MGRKAALFTKTKLMQAKEIVLESEGEKPEKDSNDRYLAWVWVDGRLLNLKSLKSLILQLKAFLVQNMNKYFMMLT